MSDLRAANGGARTTGGPVPVSQPERAHIRTPQMIMNARRQRAEAEEQRKADEERRRESTERAAQNTAAAASQARPRAAPAAAAAASSATADASPRRPHHTQHARRPSAAAAPVQPGSSTAAPPRPAPTTSSTAQPRESTTSNFPHAFERWETLSSHWEGLTSYWIRRLEQSTDEVRREPLAQQMSRQITDLSAAGANLFHAVVELQRLRASSERKFQRWFYEHRQEQERAQEREAQLSAQITTEREARLEADANMERLVTDKKNAERAVAEMKRELQISKEEARRAWEELGRREQEERDRTFSLRDGQPTLVGGVQVVPMTQNMGDPGRGHGEEYAGTQSINSGIEQHYSYEEGQSPTDTDPFTEPSRHPHRESALPSHVAQGTYVPSGATPHPSSRTAAAHAASEDAQIPEPLQYPYHTSQSQPTPTQPASSLPETFYQQPASYLHHDLENAQEDKRSYAASQGEATSEADDDYATDEQGNFIRDDAGRRIPYRSLQSPLSDEYDVQDDRRRELEHLQHYGTAATSQSGFPTTPATASTDAPAPPSDGSRPDYSGDGYGDEWVGMRHHHPTRLSDVPEEDERSRTSPSRASQASRGRLF